MEFVIWLIFCGAVGCFASQKGKNGVLWGLAALFVSPLLAGLALAMSKDEKVEDEIAKTQMETQQLRDRVAINEAYTNARFESIGTRINALQSNVNMAMLQSGVNPSAERFSAQGQGNIAGMLNAHRQNFMNQNMQQQSWQVVNMENENQVCPSCGQTIRAGAVKCRYCGTDLSNVRMVECPFCRELIREDATRCKYCRSDIPQNYGY